MPPRNPSDRYAKLERLNGELIPAINDRDKVRFSGASEEIIDAQATILHIILEIRKESGYLAGLDPDDRKIQVLLDALSQIPKGGAPAAAVDRLAAVLAGVIADAVQTTPNSQVDYFRASPAIGTPDKPSTSESVPEASLEPTATQKPQSKRTVETDDMPRGGLRDGSGEDTRARTREAVPTVKGSTEEATQTEPATPVIGTQADQPTVVRASPFFFQETAKGSMDWPSQTDPIWTITASQKGAIPVTRLGGEVDWIGPTAPHEPDDAVLTPEDEERIAEVTLSGRSELRSELEKLFGGPDWPLASVIVEPFRRYATKVFDVNVAAFRNAVSTQGRDSQEVLSAMVLNLLSEIFGREWESSPGESVTRTDWQLGIEGWKGREIVVIAGNDPDKNCLYHQLVGDAITYRYRFHAIIPAAGPGEPPGINVSNVEWWQYIGLKERHNLAMAIKPYIEDRKARWQTVYSSRRPTDAANGTEGASRSPEGPSDVQAAQEAQASKGSRKAKKPMRRNIRYEGIDRALSDISEARPKNHEEVFRFLDDRKVVIPNRKPFKATGGWLKGFQQNRHTASAWLSQAWGRLNLPAFARGPKK